ADADQCRSATTSLYGLAGWMRETLGPPRSFSDGAHVAPRRGDRPYIGHSWSGASAARVSRTSGRCMRRRKRGWRRCWRRVAPSVERMFGPVGLRANAAAGRSPAAWQAVAMAGIQRPGMRGPAYGVERARLQRAHHLLLLGAAADDQCLQ